MSAFPKSTFFPKYSHYKSKTSITNLKPSKKFHTYHTVQWLRTRHDEQLLQKSIFSLLPNNGKPIVPPNESSEAKRKRLLMEWLSTYSKAQDKFQHLYINPKYLFNSNTYEKVLKLKEIFLSFDEDGSRKMEINEMEEMFNANHIDANINELISLFFKDKNVKKEDIMKLYLDFYQFMKFALNKEQDFRLFMRNIKNKYKLEGKCESSFLPMSFNLMLDYFIIKGKERASIEIINNAIEEIENILSSAKRNDSKNIYKFDAQYQKINFHQIIQEFQNLLKIKNTITLSKHINGSNNIDNDIFFSNVVSKKRGTAIRTLSTPKIKVLLDAKRHNINDSEYLLTDHNNNNEEGEEMFSKLNKQMFKYEIKKMNQFHYEKYHSVLLAFQETKHAIAKRRNFLLGENSLNTNYINTTGSNINNSAINSTMFTTGKIVQQGDKGRPITAIKYRNERGFSALHSSSNLKLMSKTFVNKNKKNDFVPFEYIHK